MTMAGPDHVIACPHCGTRVLYGTYASIAVDLFGMPEYSDLISDWPIREFLWCVACSRCYTRGAATAIDTPDFFSPYDEEEEVRRFGDLPYGESPSEDALYAAIARGDFGDDPARGDQAVRIIHDPDENRMQDFLRRRGDLGWSE
jgi:hypothetical protein